MSGSDDRGFRWPGEGASGDGSEVVAADLSYADATPGDEPDSAAEQSTSDDAVHDDLSGESNVDSAAQTMGAQGEDIQRSDESTGDESMVGLSTDDEPDVSNVDSPIAARASDEAPPDLFETEAVAADSVGASGAEDSTVFGVPGEHDASAGVEPPTGEVAESPDEPEPGDDVAEMAADYEADEREAAEYEAADAELGVVEYADAPGDELAGAGDTDAAADESAGEIEADAAEGPGASDPAAVRVLALRQRLAELDDLPTAEHAERYEALHAELTGALTQIDRAPDGGA